MNNGAHSPLLTEAQRKIVGSAITYIAGVAIALLTIAILFVLKEFVSHFSSVLWPLVSATVLALLLQPIVLYFQKTLKLKRTWAIVLLYIFGFIIAGALLALVLPILVGQLIAFIQTIPGLIEKLEVILSNHFQGLSSRLDTNAGELSKLFSQPLVAIKRLSAASFPLLREARDTLTAAITLITGLAIIPIYLFYFLGAQLNLGERLKGQLGFLKGHIRDDILFLVNEFFNILVTFFRGQILIGLIMGILFATGFTLVGIQFGFTLGLILGMLNIIPYLGTILGLSTILPIAFFQADDGGLMRMGLALIVFVCVQITEGYFLTPRIMGEKTGLHPVAIIVSIFFWGTALDGLLGMILAIPLTAFLIVAWRLTKKNYLPQWER